MKNDYNNITFVVTDMDMKTTVFTISEYDEKKGRYIYGGKVLEKMYKEIQKRGFLLKYIRNIQVFEGSPK